MDEAWALHHRLNLSLKLKLTEAEFTRLYPRLREEHLIREAQRDPFAEEAATLARGHGGGRLFWALIEQKR